MRGGTNSSEKLRAAHPTISTGTDQKRESRRAVGEIYVGRRCRLEQLTSLSFISLYSSHENNGIHLPRGTNRRGRRRHRRRNSAAWIANAVVSQRDFSFFMWKRPLNLLLDETVRRRTPFELPRRGVAWHGMAPSPPQRKSLSNVFRTLRAPAEVCSKKHRFIALYLARCYFLTLIADLAENASLSLDSSVIGRNDAALADKSSRRVFMKPMSRLSARHAFRVLCIFLENLYLSSVYVSSART